MSAPARPTASESRVQINLEDIASVALRTGDFIGAHVPQAEPGVLRHAESRPDVVARGIGATAVKIGIRPSVEHRIALNVAISQRDTPEAEAVHDRVAEADFANVTLVLG